MLDTRSRGGRELARSAFTIIELLVVVGIFAILMAILLPALARSRETAKRVVCLSNLRQMDIAANEYASAYADSYPIGYYSANDGTTSYTYCWDLTTVSQNGQTVDVIPGLLWAGSGTLKIQQCPSFDGAANWLTDPYTGYNYNTSYIGHGADEAVVAPIRAVQVRHPAMVALFGDGQWAGGANKFMRAPWPNPGDYTFSGRWAGTQGYRHTGKTNVAFCDGHAESLADRFTDNADGAESVAASTGFLSKDNLLYDPQ